MQSFIKKLRGIWCENELLALYTSWRIGGPAQYFYQPADSEDLAFFLKNWREEDGPITFLGAGNNVLISDAGLRGVVIYLRERLNNLQVIGPGLLQVEAGVGLSRLLQKCLNLGMSDAVFLTGIPGTVGGALNLNAGAYGSNIWDYVEEVTTIDAHGNLKSRKPDEFKISYREVRGLAVQEWFTAALLKFTAGEISLAVARNKDIMEKRRASQPLDKPSCGSVFRNPPGDYAARLIEACGLKGVQIGGAQVSEKHANFIVNRGGATAKDVQALMRKITEAVVKKYGVQLVAEVHIFGEI